MAAEWLRETQNRNGLGLAVFGFGKFSCVLINSQKLNRPNFSVKYYLGAKTSSSQNLTNMEDPDYYPSAENEIQHLPTESLVLLNLNTFPTCILDVVQNSEKPLRSSQVKAKLFEGKKSGRYKFMDSTDIDIQTPPMLSRLFGKKKLNRTGITTKFEYFMPGTQIQTTKKKKKGKPLSYYVMKILKENGGRMKSGDIADELRNEFYPKFNLYRVGTCLGNLYRKKLISRFGKSKLYEYCIEDESSDEEEESDGEDESSDEEEESDGEDEIIVMRDIDDIIELDHGIQLTSLPAPSSQDMVKFNEDLKKLQADSEEMRNENQTVSRVVENLEPQFLQVAQEGIRKLQNMLEVQIEKTDEFSKNCDEWKEKYLNLKEKFEKVKTDQLKQLEELKETISTLKEKARENYQTLVKIREERLGLEKISKKNSEKLDELNQGREVLIKKIEGFAKVKDKMEADNIQMEEETSQLRIEVMGLGHEIDEMKESIIVKDQENENLKKLAEDLRNQQNQPIIQLPIQLGKRKADPYQDLDDSQLTDRNVKRRKITQCENLLVGKVEQMKKDGELESLLRSQEVQSICGEEVVTKVQDYRRQVDPLNTQIVQDLSPTLEMIQNYTTERVCDTCDCYSEYFVEFPCRHTETKICMERCFGKLCRDNGDVWCRTCARGFYGSTYENNES